MQIFLILLCHATVKKRQMNLIMGPESYNSSLILSRQLPVKAEPSQDFLSKLPALLLSTTSTSHFFHLYCLAWG